MDGTVLFRTYGGEDETCELDNWLDWPEKYKDRWPNFQPYEFRCHDGSAYMVLQVELLDGLQELRNVLKRPIHPKSGFRTKTHNEKIGGEPNSQHLLGRACDIVVVGISLAQLKKIAETISVFTSGGIGYYPKRGFLHVDVRRDGPARWTK